MKVRLVGAGSYLPRRVVTNDRIAQAIPGWSPERIAQRTGIVERRFLWDFDAKIGRSLPPPDDAHYWPRNNTDMSEVALRRALDTAGLGPRDLDAIYVVAPNPDYLNFCHDAILLHHRLGCRQDAMALVVDSGCGGALYMTDMARRMILSGTMRTVAVVASTLASPLLDREIFTSELPKPGKKRINAFLSMYMFGDGAGALILRGEEGGELGILASAAGTELADLVVHRGGGAAVPPWTATAADHAWFVDGPVVAQAYPAFMQRALDEVLKQHRHLQPEVQRYYLHQANKRILTAFAEQAGLPLDRVPTNVERYGNTSAASTLILLAEDVEQGRVRFGGGDLVLFAAVGAGVHYGAHLVRL